MTDDLKGDFHDTVVRQGLKKPQIESFFNLNI